MESFTVRFRKLNFVTILIAARESRSSSIQELSPFKIAAIL